MVANRSTAPLTPQLYVQLVRDGNPPPGESSFYYTFTGPAVYTDAAKFQKVDFGDIEDGDAKHANSATDGWVAMVQHYFASAWLPNPGVAREFYTKKVDANLYSVGMRVSAGSDRAGCDAGRRNQLYAGPQDENRLERNWRRGSNSSRTTAGSRSWPSRCSGCSTSCMACSATGAGRSSRWSCC